MEPYLPIIKRSPYSASSTMHILLQLKLTVGSYSLLPSAAVTCILVFGNHMMECVGPQSWPAATLTSQCELLSLMVGIEQVYPTLHGDVSTGGMFRRYFVNVSVTICIDCSALIGPFALNHRIIGIKSFVSFPEQKSIIWGQYWGWKSGQIGKHQLQWRCEKLPTAST